MPWVLNGKYSRVLPKEILASNIKHRDTSFKFSLGYINLFSLSAAWKIIKSWLPAAGVKKIKFLTKTNLIEYIPEDQQLAIWGGNFCKMQYYCTGELSRKSDQ